MNIMNRIKSTIKNPLQLLISLTIIAFMITVAVVYVQHRANIQRSYSLENYLAQYFNSSIRTELFDLVLNYNRADLCDELTTELTRASTSLRKLKDISTGEMSKDWSNSNKSYNYNSIKYDSILWSNSIRGYMSNNNILTTAANEVLKHKRDVWRKADNFALENSLYQSIIVLTNNNTNNGDVNNISMIGPANKVQNNADLVAEYTMILSNGLINVPRTFDYFFRLEEIAEFNISTDILRGDFYSDEKITDNFKQTVRKYSFVKEKDIIEFQPKYYIKIYYESRNRMNPDWFEIGENYIRIDGSWLVLDDKGFTTKYEDPNKVDYRLIKKGIYKSNPQFLKDIEEWIKNCEGEN